MDTVEKCFRFIDVEGCYVRIFLVVLLVLFVSGCAGPGDAIIGLGSDGLESAQANGATSHRIFVATTRAKSENPLELFSGERSTKLSLAHIDVTIPPTHEPGKIEKTRSRKPDPEKHFVVTKPYIFAEPTFFKNKINDALSVRDKDSRDVLVFVHGYNVDFSDAVLRVAQFVHDANYKGVPVLFSWASRGRTVDYVYDLNSALQARDRLEQLGALLTQTHAQNFDVVAHSMGNLVTVEAMRQVQMKGHFNTSGRLRRIVLASPDIDVDLFRTQLDVFPEKEDQFFVLISKDDKALEVSRFLAGGVSRAGAADPQKLASLGINVIDLTEVDDKSGIHHSKFADSPAIVQLIGRGIQQGNTLSSEDEVNVAKTLVGNVFRSLTLVPSAIINGAQGSVLVVGNQ